MILSHVEYEYDRTYTTINQCIFKVDLVMWENKHGIMLGKKGNKLYV